MEKTLKTIQTLSKVGEILSRVVFILCIVGFVLSAVGAGMLAAGVTTLRFGGKDLEVILFEAGVSLGTVWSSLIVGMILCAAEAVIARFAVRYFRREQQDGTPFDIGGAKELFRLGILQIAVTLAAEILAGISHGVVSRIYTDVEELSFDGASALMLGVSMLVISLICRYGAEKSGIVAPPSDHA